MEIRTFRSLSPLLAAIVLLSSCSSGSSGEESAASTGLPGERIFTSDCGALVGGSLQNPVSESSGQKVVIKRVISAGTVITSGSSGDQLLRLAGIAESQGGFANAAAQNILEGLSAPPILYLSDPSCTSATLEGGTATFATLFDSVSGSNLNEQIITNGHAAADSSSQCGVPQISGCYRALDEASILETGAQVTNFLWKPAADRDGSLVVLLNPSALTVLVNGEALIASGPSNGRATTMRGSKSGCAYGANVKVEAFDELGRPLVFPGAQLSFSIANGCQRIEFQ